ncbi:MAG: SAM-dependent methyltransferase [Hyphomicrobium sp.]|nr:MAG: SAM-dependent methyltransferase [Hyphomicrobium sp.]PPD01596.1 MAG: SAM-dependent methyltransferase [Hyphomicrobium sp.]
MTPPLPETVAANLFFRNRHVCRNCGHAITQTLVDLGVSPLCESFLPASRLDEMEAFYPLRAMVCDECFLVQLGEYVTPEHIFTEYAYYSSYSTSWVAHAKRYCELMRQRLALDANSLVVELASNDGYLLQHFLPVGIPVLGVEPAANVAAVAIEKGVPTVVDFFGMRLAQQMSRDGKKADLIAGNNVLAQVPDLNDFVAGMKILLAPEGVITLEFPHIERLIAESQFDTIYHEHFSYFSLTTIETLAARHQLRIIDVEQLPTHGGSLRVYLSHLNSAHPVSARVASLLDLEIAAGIRNIATYLNFTSKVERVKRDLLRFLITCKDDGLKVCGYGAPGKGNTLLNYCGIGTDLVSFTVDRNPYKHYKFTPGRHIPIRPVEAIDIERPDIILILPWNLRSEIAHQMRHIGQWGGRFVVPIPALEIIEPLELQ